MIRLDPTISVHTPLGPGDAMFIIPMGENCNDIWKVRMLSTGKPVNFYDDDIRIYGNLMNGQDKIDIPDLWKK